MQTTLTDFLNTCTHTCMPSGDIRLFAQTLSKQAQHSNEPMLSSTHANACRGMKLTEACMSYRANSAPSGHRAPPGIPFNGLVLVEINSAKFLAPVLWSFPCHVNSCGSKGFGCEGLTLLRTVLRPALPGFLRCTTGAVKPREPKNT